LNEISDFSQKFLDEYSNNISHADFNAAFNTGIIAWKDNPIYGAESDAFEFHLDGKDYRLDSENASEYLFEKLMQVKRKEAEERGLGPTEIAKYVTPRSIVKKDYFDEFHKNNPQLVESGRLEEVFFKFWNDNQDKINKDNFVAGSESAEIFGATTKEKSNEKHEGQVRTAERDHIAMKTEILEKKLTRLRGESLGELSEYDQAVIEAIEIILNDRKERQK
jgi:hypothetical protein